jgi:predicted DNA-binding transcriptional regulator AlpA
LLKRQLAAVLDMMAGQKKERDPSIGGFCKRHGISRATFFNLRRAGKAPRVTAIGSRRVISEDAEREWVKAREAEDVIAPARNKRQAKSDAEIAELMRNPPP